jgi:hypothetical protein
VTSAARSRRHEGTTVHARDRAKAESAFPNAMTAEQFFNAHTRGRWRIYPRTDGLYVLVDMTAPMGTAGRVFNTLPEAERALAKRPAED